MITYEQWSAKYYALPSGKRNAFVWRSLESKKMLPIFGRFFFPHVIKTRDCPELHYDLCNVLANPDHQAAVIPRGHAKTTWSRIDLIHDIVYEHEEFIIFVGDALAAAKRALAFVRNQLESNQALIEIYGDRVPPFSTKTIRHWNDEHIQCTKGVVALAIGALKGRGLNIDAKRPTKALVDDLEDKEAVKNPMQREKYSSWMYETLMPAMDKDKGKIKMIGTVLHYDCLVLNFYKKFGGIKRAALENKKGEPSLDGDPIWWDRTLLEEKRKDIGSFAFAQEYMNDPQSDANSDVKRKWIRYAEDIQFTDKQDRPLFKVYSAMDPAISEKTTADETAICSVAKEIGSEQTRIYVLGTEHGRWNADKSCEIAATVYNRYDHEKFGVETVAFQEVLRRILASKGVNAKPMKPSKDKRSRLQSIVGLIEFGNIIFLPGNEDLIEQLVQFPNGAHDDMVDAFVYAILLAIGSDKEFISVTI